MLPSGSSQNRVKSIKSRFEVLNDQAKYGDTDAKLQNTTTVPLNLKKIVIPKENIVQKGNPYLANNDHSSNKLFEFKNCNSNEYLGASTNFGNRKRLKDHDDFNGNYVEESQTNYVDCNLVSQDIEKANRGVCFEDCKENYSASGNQKSLSRHHSDPIKKLHRSPAFRCDRSEKLKDSRKNSFNSDCSDNGIQPNETDRCKLSRDKLKRLGYLLEEKMKHDNFEFSKPKTKTSVLKVKDFEDSIVLDSTSGKNNLEDKLDKHHNKISSERTLQDIKDQLKPIVYSGVLKSNKTNDSKPSDIIMEDLQIPQHILDQYAQVIKPKNRNAFVKKSPTSKIDAVLSDSGVSSESENLISDDLDESETTPKFKSFKAIRSNFETKNNNNQGKEEVSSRRKFMRRSSEDKKVTEQSDNSSKENLLDSDCMNVGEVNNGIDNAVYASKSNEILNATNNPAITDTLKRVLQQPLPPGPPPKKPPRTFAALPTSPTKSIEANKSPENSKSKNKDGKSKYKNRTKEESKLMLEKIESALLKHENGGMILSPRPVRKDNYLNSETSLSDSWTRQSTKPSTAKLKKSQKKVEGTNEPKPKELHYMCTEILDINNHEPENILNSSNASLNSMESFQTTNSFTKCLNSLNCANPGLKYTKLNSSLNSANTSQNSVCCSCSFTSPRDQTKSSRNSVDEFSLANQTRRLSTFSPSPSKSIENLNLSHNSCDACGNNPSDQFVCHINNSSKRISTHEYPDESKSVFFVDRKYETKSEVTPHYGVLKKCKSQEHIYAEPAELKKSVKQHQKDNEKSIPKSNSSTNVPFNNCPISSFKPPPLVRTRTQLEDGFGKIREVDSTKILSSQMSPEKDNLINANKKSINPEIDISNAKNQPELLVSKNVSEEIKSSDSNKGSKVKDILMRLENGRASLRIQNYKRTDDVRKSLAIRSNGRVNSNSNVFDSVTQNRNKFSGSNGTVDKIAKETPSPDNLHYSSAKIYDTPEVDDSPTGSGQEAKQMKVNPDSFLAVNSSFLYGLERTKQKSNLEPSSNEGATVDTKGVMKRPPLYDRKATTMQNSNMKGRRLHSLYLTDQRSEPQSNRTFFTESRRRRSPTEVDKEHLSRLMTEIYDTVAEACILEGSTTAASGESEHDTSDEVSLKLTRSLTEKRKRYVRRVTSRVGFLSEDHGDQIQRQEPFQANCGAETADGESDANFKSYSTFPSRQTIKNASFLHSSINKEQDMADSIANVTLDVGETEQETRKEIITKGGGLFEACILAGMNFSTGQAYIKNIYPEMVVIPPQIESLVFPESVVTNMTGDLNPPKSRPMRICDEAPDIQCYALVLTNEKGLRTYAYCRRVLPEGATHCLPLSYCIISRHRAPAFYYKVLQEIESHHGSSDNVVNSVLGQLYSSEFPKPGTSIKIKQMKSPKRLVVTDSSFRKSTPYRNSVNLGDVLKSGSCDKINGTPTSSSSSQSLLVDSSSDKFRRKSSGNSANFPELKLNDLSVMKSLEKIYGENLKEFKSDLIDLNEALKSSPSVSFNRELGSKSSTINFKSSCDNSSENLRSESSEGYRNEGSSADTDSEEFISKEYHYSVRGDLDIVQIKRPLEPRLDEDNLSVLFETFSVSNLVKIFGTLIIERKVVIVCDKLSKLSSCIEALQSILYPLTWQHTLVSSIPRDMTRDILEAPIPILAGLILPLSVTTSKHAHPELDKIHFDEGMLIDISNGEERLIKVQGDESTLLPPLLAKTLKASLQLVVYFNKTGPPITTPSSPSDEHARKTRNVLVAEAFLRFFVEVLGDCKKYFVESTDPPDSPIKGIKGKYKFEKDQFIRSFRSKHVQYFLEWFTETAMFNTYIQQRILLLTMELPSLGKSDTLNTSMMDLPYPDFYEMFDERVARRGTSQSARVQLSNVGKEGVSKGNYKMIVNKKVKVWRDKLRDLVS